MVGSDVLQSYVGRLKGKDAFLHDLVVQDAVIRNFEVIGESTKRLPVEYREATPEIPWKGLTSLRDVLIHQYNDKSIAAGIDQRERDFRT